MLRTTTSYIKKLTPQLVNVRQFISGAEPAWLGMPYGRKDAFHVASGQYMDYDMTMFLRWENSANGKVYKNPTPEQDQLYNQ